MFSLEEELTNLERMAEVPNIEDLISISQKCRRAKNLVCAKRLLAHVYNNKLEAHGRLGNHLVPMFVECASLSDAEQVFWRLPHCNKYSWNFLVQGFVENGDSQRAFHLFQQMQELCVHTNMPTLQALLKACAKGKCLERGQGVHAVIAKEGFEMDSFVCSTLVDMYCKCGALAEAQEVFNDLSIRDVVLWTALISGYVEHGFAKESLIRLREMQLEGTPADSFTFACTLKACANLQAIDKGREIHSDICIDGLEKDTIVGSAVLDMYAKCGSLAEAKDVFDGLLLRDVVAWTALITCYAEHGLSEEVLDSLEQMHMQGISPNAITYVCSLKSCIDTSTIEAGQKLHYEIVCKGFNGDTMVGSALLDMYAKCGLLAEAQKTFNVIPAQDVVAWTSLIAGYVEHGDNEAALNCMEQMQIKSIHPNVLTFFCSLKACAGAGAIDRGREIHNEICKEGFDGDYFVWINLMKMYAKSGFFLEAEDVFDELLVQCADGWNVLIAEYVEQGIFLRALEFLKIMLLEGVPPNAMTFVHSLKACSSIGDIDRGKIIHTEISLDGLEKVLVVGNALVDMYVKCGSLIDAQEVFDELPVRDVISWNTLLLGYVEHGLGEEAFMGLQQMQVECISSDSVTFVCSLKACILTGTLSRGQQIYYEVAKEGYEKDPSVSGTLLDFYTKFGFLLEAQDVFDELSVPGVIHWTILIAGYAEHGLDGKALDCMGKMQLEGVPGNVVTSVCGLKACGNQRLLARGQEIHDEAIKKGYDRDPFVGSSLMEMYGKCTSLAGTQLVFDGLHARDLVCWNVLLDMHVENDRCEEALNFLVQMQLEGIPPDAATYVSSLKACSILRVIDIGREIHASIIKRDYEEDPCVGRLLVDMYAKCGFLEEAREVLNKLSVRNVALWNVMMVGYSEYGHNEQTLDCFEMMLSQGMTPDVVSFVCALKACSCVGAVEQGCEIVKSISEKLLEGDLVLGNVVLDMYAKCGAFAKAKEFFDGLPVRDVVSWSLLIAGYARLGNCDLVFDLFVRMKDAKLQPDGIISLSVLSMCTHAGLVDKGQTFFEAMVRDYGIIPTIEHHNCLLDILGRAGQMGGVVELVESKLFEPNVKTWITILGASQKWGFVELAKHAFDNAVKLDYKEAAAAYIMMANIHADAHGSEVITS